MINSNQNPQTLQVQNSNDSFKNSIKVNKSYLDFMKITSAGKQDFLLKNNRNISFVGSDQDSSQNNKLKKQTPSHILH